MRWWRKTLKTGTDYYKPFISKKTIHTPKRAYAWNEQIKQINKSVPMLLVGLFFFPHKFDRWMINGEKEEEAKTSFASYLLFILYKSFSPVPHQCECLLNEEKSVLLNCFKLAALVLLLLVLDEQKHNSAQNFKAVHLSALSIICWSHVPSSPSSKSP